MSALGILVELIGYSIARAALPFLSFGWFTSSPSTQIRGDAMALLCRDATGRVEIRQAVAGWIGLGICLIMLVAIALLISAFVCPHPA